MFQQEDDGDMVRKRKLFDMSIVVSNYIMHGKSQSICPTKQQPEVAILYQCEQVGPRLTQLVEPFKCQCVEFASNLVYIVVHST